MLQVKKKKKRLYLMPGAANDGGEDGTRSVIPSKPSFAHTRSIVNNEGSNFFFHFLQKEKSETQHLPLDSPVSGSGRWVSLWCRFEFKNAGL